MKPRASSPTIPRGMNIDNSAEGRWGGAHIGDIGNGNSIAGKEIL